MSILELPYPYLLFLGDATQVEYVKTACGLRDWAPQRCVGECALPGSSVTTGLPPMTPAQAYARGARSLVIGAAPVGGVLSPTWIPCLVEALEAGLDLISGMHMRLSANSTLKLVAERCGRQLFDVRVPPLGLSIATGRKRSGKRLLTVGTDCALGKKYTALALARAFVARGLDAQFRATGQTGILIAGHGIPIDAVVAGLVAGAAESHSPDAADNHWDIVEGQGSLFHPAYAGVSLGLLHGTQPDVIVVCHQAGRERVSGLESFGLPGLEDTIDLNLRLARRTNPAVRCAGVSLNTSNLSGDEACSVLAKHSALLGLPCADPIRGGIEFDALADACLKA